MRVHGELTADGREIVLIANGPEHQVALAAKQLELMTPLVRKSKPPGALVLPATWAALVQLSHTFQTLWQPGPRLTQWIAEELERRTGSNGHIPPLPDGLTPRAYQVEAAGMIARTGRTLLFDEQGTGKTVSAILGLVERGAFPVVCVVPASVVNSWVEHWRAWAPDLCTVAWRGTPKKRHALAGTADVYVASYDTARMDARDNQGPLCGLGARAVVADEIHFIKSPRAKRSLATRRLARKAEAFVALSGTPITHHPGDLWPTLEALEPTAWPSRERWVSRYCVVIPGDYADDIAGLDPHYEPEFRTSLVGQHRRIAKADVLDQLPPKIYSVRTVELPPAWRRAYDDMADQMIAALPEGGELSVMGVLAQLTRLSQMASAATNVETTTETRADGTERDHTNVRLRLPSWKVDALLEILAERPGSPVVVFAPSRQLVVLAGRAAAESEEHYRVGYVIGGQRDSERAETIKAFQAGELDLLCATTGAGGVGLTLTAAATCVFLQRPWSLVEAIQAEDRLHRIGAERHDSIEIIDVVAKNTLDTRVRSVLREKAGQLSDLVQDPRIVAELLGGTKRKRKV